MRPTFLPNGMVSKTSSSHKTATATLTSVDCPQGTVPIRRYKKENLIRAKSFSDSHVSNIHPMTKEYPGQHLAILRSTKLEPQRGIRATMSLNNPHPVDKFQASMAEMWVQSNFGDQMNGLQAGWIVAPDLNGDDHTHMFTLTTTNNYNTSCFNTLCGSFIQTNPKQPVDAELSPVSVFLGQQYVIDLAIIQDNFTRDWWLVLDGNIYIGYFPANIFTQLTGGGSYIAWGGLTRSQVGRPSPPMGAGYDGWGGDNFNILGYFYNLKLVDASNNYIDPNRHHLETYADSHCYGLRYRGKYEDKGHLLFYGGKEYEDDPCGI
ncbi:3-methyl-2-oxobutanoate hydroxymethyltransferase [Thalictrum thalictroides]|uniref:3-methyl-2-oxobutanoate hydroxymethyltransferase n=1 Tax=Thalictrum thalictroides TaxID=46969 RepID=A0A7J6X5Q3_THATH|nr:3-methyl-2-oxobutanoate hydroxymethyltransferase [Thalictrum thalictroides]